MNPRRRNSNNRPLVREDQIILNQAEPGQAPELPAKKERLFEYVEGKVKKVFRINQHGQMELVKNIPLAGADDSAQRTFRLRPVPMALRGKQPHKTYKIFAPKLNKDYRFYQANGDWDKVHDPKKEKIVAVDDETARSLETMKDVFEEVFVTVAPEKKAQKPPIQEPEEQTVAFPPEEYEVEAEANGDE